MARELNVPPGRAGRLWLVQRLEVAHRAAGLLDRKLAALTAELARLREAAAGTGRDWVASCAAAQDWLLRAVLLGGERSVRLATRPAEAEVTVWHTVTMGVRHPAGARCHTGVPDDWPAPALPGARRAHATALQAAVRHAAALAAVAAVERETQATRQRLRAVRDRVIPRLEQALARVEFALEEQERADAARLRQARDRPAGPRAREP